MCVKINPNPILVHGLCTVVHRNLNWPLTRVELERDTCRIFDNVIRERAKSRRKLKFRGLRSYSRCSRPALVRATYPSRGDAAIAPF